MASSPEVTFGDNVRPVRNTNMFQKAHSRHSYWNDSLPDKAMASFVERDKDKSKTYSRKLVENYLSKYDWYFPQRQDSNAPSLMKAWAFYEHVTLARYQTESEGEHNLVMAQPGDIGETRLYPALNIPSAALAEWGIGVGMYFSTLWKVAVLFLLSGIIMLANVVYYAGSDYDGQHDSSFLIGSAVCTRKEWVVCQNCVKEDWKYNPTEYAELSKDTSNHTVGSFNSKNLKFVQHNVCKGAEMSQSMVTFAAVLFLFICFGFLEWYLRQQEVRFDENWMTASDYSIWIKNPPADAKDPEEWRTFFNQYASKQVTCCTIALDNEELFSSLIQRRTYKFELEKILGLSNINVDLDDDVETKEAIELLAQKKSQTAGTKSYFAIICSRTIYPLLRFAGFSPPKPPILAKEIIRLKEKIIGLEKKTYNAISVFVTFETEEGQRLALESLDVSLIDRITKKTKNTVTAALFRGKHFLQVQEAPEPSAVRWMELNSKVTTRLMQRCINISITVGMAALSGLFINYTRDNEGPFTAAVLLSVSNFFIPYAVKLLIQYIEIHTTDTSYQKSLYIQVSIFRWINAVFLIDFITPVSTALDDGIRDMIPTVGYIFLSELIVTPLLQLIDIEGLYRKHIVAPRAKTQQDMNLAFTGTHYNIGERYTDLTKIFALAVYHASLIPISLIFGSVILFVQYYTDRFCLVRIWKQAPFVGPKIAQFCRRYFFNIALLIFAVVTTFKYALFPYDNICFPTTTSSDQYEGQYNVRLADDSEKKIIVTHEYTVEHCDQFKYIVQGGDFLNPWHSKKHPTDSKWMTDSQEIAADIFGVFMLIAVFYILLVVFGTQFFTFIKHCFRPSYKPEGKDQRIDFSNLTDQATIYVPQKKVHKFAFPLLFCDIDDIELSLIGWNPEPVPYDFYNLMFDCFVTPTRPERKRAITRKNGSVISKAKHEFTDMSNDNLVPERTSYEKGIFSIVKQWQPKWVDENESEI